MTEGEKTKWDITRLLIKLEKARKKFSATDLGNKERLLAVSREVDGLIVEYYRTKFDFS